MHQPRIPANHVLIPLETRARMSAYVTDLLAGRAIPGARFLTQLQSLPEWQHHALTVHDAFRSLLRTKIPRIFAESEIHGDGCDWNATELSLLGDISVLLPVTVFDDARHQSPQVHDTPLRATLVFTPGPLLCNGHGNTPADWNDVVGPDGVFDESCYFRLIERRLLPVFRAIDAQAGAKRRPAIVTMPGLGCGQFAGKFHGTLGSYLGAALLRFLHIHGSALPNLSLVWFDPYNECQRETHQIGKLSFRIRPLLANPPGLPQLCQPTDYQELGDDFSKHLLFSIVAWDHVSWPGNDFFAGSRCTDDGVKAAATDAMAVLTGKLGRYDTRRNAYLPPAPYRTWEELARKENLTPF